MHNHCTCLVCVGLFQIVFLHLLTAEGSCRIGARADYIQGPRLLKVSGPMSPPAPSHRCMAEPSVWSASNHWGCPWPSRPTPRLTRTIAARSHTWVDKQMHTNMLTCMRAFTHTHVHIPACVQCAHTHIHTYTHTHSLFSACSYLHLWRTHGQTGLGPRRRQL